MRAAERNDAKKRGALTYFTGKPCTSGHIAERSTSSGGCIECRREYDRRAYRENPGKSAAKAAKRYAAKADHIKSKRREWYAANKDKAKETKRLYMAKNGDEVLRKARSSAASYRKRFPERAKKSITEWWEKNPGRKKAYHHARRARKRGNGGSYTPADVASILKGQGERCAYCRCRLGDAYHVDHIIPLAKGGSSDRRNLQILCEPCNLAKGAKHPIDYARTLGLLL